MNYIVNDRGKTVVAEGSPGSDMRIKCEYPGLIDRLNSLFWEGNYPGNRVDLAIEAIRDIGIKNAMETNRILDNTHFRRNRFEGEYDETTV